jgi:hypothetical protein
MGKGDNLFIHCFIMVRSLESMTRSGSKTLRATNHTKNYTGVLVMANCSLPHFNAESYYQISLQNLEEIHIKINQGHAVLSILSDWVTECESCSLSLKQRTTVDFALYLLVTLIEQVKELLPEV